MWKVEGGVTAHLDPKKCQRNAVVTDDNGQLWVFGRTEEEARLNIGSEGLNLARVIMPTRSYPDDTYARWIILPFTCLLTK